MDPKVSNRSQPNRISVLISGAGVGGLMTALECWRNGCDVRIFERSKGVVTIGTLVGYIQHHGRVTLTFRKATPSALLCPPSALSRNGRKCIGGTKK